MRFESATLFDDLRQPFPSAGLLVRCQFAMYLLWILDRAVGEDFSVASYRFTLYTHPPFGFNFPNNNQPVEWLTHQAPHSSPQNLFSISLTLNAKKRIPPKSESTRKASMPSMLWPLRQHSHQAAATLFAWCPQFFVCDGISAEHTVQRVSTTNGLPSVLALHSLSLSP